MRGSLGFGIDINLIGGRGSGGVTPPTPIGDLPQATWDTLNKDASISLSNSDRDATSTAAGWKSARSVESIPTTETEEVYFELQQPGENGVLSGGIGFGDITAGFGSFMGADTLGAMYTPVDGNIYFNGAPVANIGIFTGVSAVINGVFDPVTREVWFGNSGPPDTTLAAHATIGGTGDVYLTCSLNGAGATGRLSAVPRQWWWRTSTELSGKKSINGPIPTITKKVAGFGDSISTTTIIPMALTDGAQHLYQEANSDTSISSMSSVQGRTAVQGNGNYASLVTPMYDASLECTLVTWLGTNDIFFAQGQANNATAALAGIISQAKAEGWANLFINNVLQRGTVDAGHGGTITDWRTDADTINSWISANDTDYAEILMRETNDDFRWETAPFTGAGPNPPYGDTAHPTHVGYQDMIPAIETAL